MTHEELRKRHFERLNDYRNSLEYQQSPNCYDKRDGDFPSLLGNRWEIDEAIYDEFLETLPPPGWLGGTFYMSEFTFDDITAKFTKEGDRFFCEFARWQPPRLTAQQRACIDSVRDSDKPLLMKAPAGFGRTA